MDQTDPCPYCRGYPAWAERKLGSICPCQVKCSNCIWVQHLMNVRPDEPSNLACRKPGWEGYTKDEKPDCGGVFFMKRVDTKPEVL
jgi:hypothetical protein